MNVRKLIAIFCFVTAIFAVIAAGKDEGAKTMVGSKCGPAAPTLTITWQRLVEGGETCPRCSATEEELDKAVGQLAAALEPLGIAVVFKKEELTAAAFKAAPAASNRIWLNGRLMEDWLGGRSDTSVCCDVCGDEECRTVVVDGEVYESVPAALVVKAGLAAASALTGTSGGGGCCPSP
ncbi:MAG: DUF2703 domain-containing protein [bacterium]